MLPRRLLVAVLIDNMKNHTLIVGHDFSIANETDRDVYTDYFPGIWAISSQKQALNFARKILAEGDEITVTDYDQPKYHTLANKFIKALGLKQALYPEPKSPEQKPVTNGKPANLAELKRYLVTGRKVKIINYGDTGKAIGERDTSVIGTQTNAVIFDKNGGKSWLEYGKAESWTFDEQGATNYAISAGEYRPLLRIAYNDQP